MAPLRRQHQPRHPVAIERKAHPLTRCNCRTHRTGGNICAAINGHHTRRGKPAQRWRDPPPPCADRRAHCRRFAASAARSTTITVTLPFAVFCRQRLHRRCIRRIQRQNLRRRQSRRWRHTSPPASCPPNSSDRGCHWRPLPRTAAPRYTPSDTTPRSRPSPAEKIIRPPRRKKRIRRSGVRYKLLCRVACAVAVRIRVIGIHVVFRHPNLHSRQSTAFRSSW